MGPVGPVGPVAPVSGAYPKSFQAEVPLPNLTLNVSFSYPISPRISVGFAAVHSAAVPRRIKMLRAIYVTPPPSIGLVAP